MLITTVIKIQETQIIENRCYRSVFNSVNTCIEKLYTYLNLDSIRIQFEAAEVRFRFNEMTAIVSVHYEDPAVS